MISHLIPDFGNLCYLFFFVSFSGLSILLAFSKNQLFVSFYYLCFSVFNFSNSCSLWYSSFYLLLGYFGLLSSFLRWKLSLMIWDFFLFSVIALTVSCNFWYCVFSFDSLWFFNFPWGVFVPWIMLFSIQVLGNFPIIFLLLIF